MGDIVPEVGYDIKSIDENGIKLLLKINGKKKESDSIMIFGRLVYATYLEGEQKKMVKLRRYKHEFLKQCEQHECRLIKN